MARAPTLEAELIRGGKEFSGLCPALLCQTQLAGQVWGSGCLPSGLVLGTRTFGAPCAVPGRAFTAKGPSHSVPGGWGGAGDPKECAERPLDQLYLHRSLSETPVPSSRCRPPLPPLLPSPLRGPLPLFLSPSPSPHRPGGTSPSSGSLLCKSALGAGQGLFAPLSLCPGTFI